MTNNTRAKLPLIKASTDDAKEWLRIDLLSGHLGWDAAEQLFQLSFNLDADTGAWHSSFPTADKASKCALRRNGVPQPEAEPLSNLGGCPHQYALSQGTKPI